MFDGRTLQHLNLTLQDIFDNHTDSFAVISVLTVGDLLQLNTAVFKTLQFGYEALADYLYGRTSSSCMNRDIVRQSGDPELTSLLSRVRIGEMAHEDITLLSELQNTPLADFPDDTISLFFTNEQVHKFNENKMKMLTTPKITIKDSKKDMHTTL